MPDLPLDPTTLADFHDAVLAGESPRSPGDHACWTWAAVNHDCNAALWAQEDQARCPDMPDARIVACKRAIDRLNQQRNDAVEQFDEALLEALRETGASARGDARLHSESAGAIVDRLSILALKIHHMRAEVLREEAAPAHALSCAARLERLLDQRRLLLGCLDELLLDAAEGRVRWSVWRQFKMYNDPSTNPWLRGRHAGEQAERERRTPSASPQNR